MNAPPASDRRCFGPRFEPRRGKKLNSSFAFVHTARREVPRPGRYRERDKACVRARHSGTLNFFYSSLEGKLAIYLAPLSYPAMLHRVVPPHYYVVRILPNFYPISAPQFGLDAPQRRHISKSAFPNRIMRHFQLIFLADSEGARLPDQRARRHPSQGKNIVYYENRNLK